MIDCDVKFGAFVPKIPQIYKDAIRDDDDDDDKKDGVGCSIGNKWTSCKLLSKQSYNHNTSIFEFELSGEKKFLNLPITDHLLVKAPGHGGNGGSSSDATTTTTETVRPYTTIDESTVGKFSIMVKRYDEWGIPEKKQRQQNQYYLYVKTDHSYKPPGIVSNYIHNLNIGQNLQFKYDPSICSGRISYPFPNSSITAITMIAVGIGVVPMIRIIRAILSDNNNSIKLRLLYGIRTVSDILLREQLDKWHDDNNNNFRVCYCVGSRYANITFGAKTSSQKTGPALPKDYDTIPSDRKQLGWVSSDVILKYGASDAQDDGHRIFLCGLPGVYMALAGPRSEPTTVKEGSQLYTLGYRNHQVIKF